MSWGSLQLVEVLRAVYIGGMLNAASASCTAGWIGSLFLNASELKKLGIGGARRKYVDLRIENGSL